MPTRNARNGGIFTKNGTMNMRNAKWANDYSPLDEEISPNYSKAYVRHLIHSGELLGNANHQSSQFEILFKINGRGSCT